MLLDGRRADPDEPDEVTLSETAAAKLGLGVGDLFEVGSLSPAAGGGLLQRRRGADVARRAAAASAGRRDHPQRLRPQRPRRGHGAHRHHTGVLGEVRSRHRRSALAATWFASSTSPDAVDQFTAAVAAAYGDEHLPSINVGQGEDAIADSISVITAALVAMALVIAVAGLLWIGSALARHQRVAAPDIDVLRALGTTAGERRSSSFGCVAAGALAGRRAGAPLAPSPCRRCSRSARPVASTRTRACTPTA